MNRISPHERTLLIQKLSHLWRLRTDSDALFERIERELTSDKNQFVNGTRTIDAIGTVATGVASLGFLIRDGFAAMRLTGHALEKANQELAKSAFHVAYDPARDILLDQAGESLGAHKGLRHYFGTALHILANLSTPSYWAAVYTNKGKSWDEIANSSADTLVDDSMRQIREQHRRTIESIDRNITQTQSLLN